MSYPCADRSRVIAAAYLGLQSLFMSAMGYFETIKMKIRPDHPLDLLDEMVRE